MSKLLLLADVAVSDKASDGAKRTAEIAVQTDDIASVSTPGCSTSAIDHSVHDYVKSADFDFLVNSTHDYYDRVTAPENESEHSYAFPLPIGDSRRFDHDEHVEEEQDMDNLDMQMQFTPQECEPLLNARTDAHSPKIFEEIVLNSDDAMESSSLLGAFSPRSDLGDILAAISDQTEDTVIEVGGVEFEDIVRYLTASETEVDVATDDCPTACSSELQDMPSEEQQLEQEGEQEEVSEEHEFACCWKSCVWRGANIHALSTHLDVAHLSRPTAAQQWRCLWRSCERTQPFGRRYLLARHLRCHTADRPFECGVCLKSFPTQDRLTVHERIHSGSRPYACSTCARTFSSTADRRRHALSHQQRDSEFACRHCDRSYRNSGALRKHIRNNHA